MYNNRALYPEKEKLMDITVKDTTNLGGVIASLDLTAGDRKVPRGLLSKRGWTVIAETYYNVEELELYNTNINYKK